MKGVEGTTLQGAAVDMHAKDDSNADGESPEWIGAEGKKQPFRWVGRIPLARRKDSVASRSQVERLWES